MTDPTTVGGSDQSTSGTERCWDHEDCPRVHCDGELQQQDRFNVMCLECETVFTHQKDDNEHRLIHDCEFVARKPRAFTDGGSQRTECWNCGYQRLVFEACPECGEYGGDA